MPEDMHGDPLRAERPASVLSGPDVFGQATFDRVASELPAVAGAPEQVRRVLAIPFKKTDTRLVPYLAKDETQALLDAPDPSTREGIRDRAMLHLAVCAGLRVSELTGLRIDHVAPQAASTPRAVGFVHSAWPCR